MSKLARTLLLAATVAAMNLAGLAAIANAQANDQDPTTQRELAENWNYYQQATRVPPAELQAWMQADATQRKLSENWTYYYHATRMSPAELKAWLQAQDRADTPTEPPASVPAPRRPPEPSGQPGWLVVSLGGLAAVLAVVAGLALLAAGVPTAGLGSSRRPNDGHGPVLDGAAAPTGSPIALPATRLVPIWSTATARVRALARMVEVLSVGSAESSNTTGWRNGRRGVRPALGAASAPGDPRWGRGVPGGKPRARRRRALQRRRP